MSDPSVEDLCEICGGAFLPRTKRHIYCSPPCRQEASNRRVKNFMKTDKGRELKKRDNQRWKQAKRVSELRRRYEMTPEEWNQIVVFATDRCYICGVDEDLCIDHCHESGLVRGVLCRKHNAALGSMGDSLEMVELYVQYLTTISTRNPDGFGIRDEQERNLWSTEGRLRDRSGDPNRS